MVAPGCGTTVSLPVFMGTACRLPLWRVALQRPVNPPNDFALVLEEESMDNATAPGIQVRKKPLKTRIAKYKWFYLMFVPVLVFIIVFYYTPMVGIRYAFTQYKLIKDPVFVGMKNFNRLFSLPNFWTAFYNTLKLSIGKLLLNTGLAVVISLLLHEIVSLRVKKLAQTIIYLPHFLSWVVAASVFQMLLSPTTAGLLNQLLIKLGIIDESIYFLGNSRWWTSTYYMINVWKDTGWGTVIFMAALSAIDPGVYEAAAIDGAGRWKKMWYITIPALSATILTVLILNLAKVMNLFESAFVLQNAAVMDKGQVLQTYIYYQTFNSGGIPDYGYTTAVGLFKSVVGMFLVLICNYASKKVRGRGIV